MTSAKRPKKWRVEVFFSSIHHPEAVLIKKREFNFWVFAWLFKWDNDRWSDWKQSWGVIERIKK